MSKLPKGWELVETGTVTIVGAGTGFKPDFQGFTDREIPFYKVSDMNLPLKSSILHHGILPLKIFGLSLIGTIKEITPFFNGYISQLSGILPSSLSLNSV